MLFFKIGRTTVNISTGGVIVTTTLPSSKTVKAIPHTTPEYLEQARKLGYDGAYNMNLHHDLVHVMCAHWLGLGVSPALDAASREEEINALTGAEEDMVLAVQRFANLAGINLLTVAAKLGGISDKLGGGIVGRFSEENGNRNA